MRFITALVVLAVVASVSASKHGTKAVGESCEVGKGECYHKSECSNKKKKCVVKKKYKIEKVPKTCTKGMMGHHCPYGYNCVVGKCEVDSKTPKVPGYSEPKKEEPYAESKKEPYAEPKKEPYAEPKKEYESKDTPPEVPPRNYPGYVAPTTPGYEKKDEPSTESYVEPTKSETEPKKEESYGASTTPETTYLPKGTPPQKYVQKGAPPKNYPGYVKKPTDTTANRY